MVLYNRSRTLPSMTVIVRFARTIDRPGRKQSHSVGKQSVKAEPTPIVKRSITDDVSRIEHQFLHSAQMRPQEMQQQYLV